MHHVQLDFGASSFLKDDRQNADRQFGHKHQNDKNRVLVKRKIQSDYIQLSLVNLKAGRVRRNTYDQQQGSTIHQGTATAAEADDEDGDTDADEDHGQILMQRVRRCAGSEQFVLQRSFVFDQYENAERKQQQAGKPEQRVEDEQQQFQALGPATQVDHVEL